MSYHTFRVVYDKRENQHRSRSYQIPQIKIEGMFLYFFKELKKSRPSVWAKWNIIITLSPQCPRFTVQLISAPLWAASDSAVPL